MLSSPATQDVDNSHEGPVDQKDKTNYNLRGNMLMQSAKIIPVSVLLINRMDGQYLLKHLH